MTVGKMASTTMAKTLESGQISLNPESTARDLTVYPDATRWSPASPTTAYLGGEGRWGN